MHELMLDYIRYWGGQTTLASTAVAPPMRALVVEDECELLHKVAHVLLAVSGCRSFMLANLREAMRYLWSKERTSWIRAIALFSIVGILTHSEDHRRFS